MKITNSDGTQTFWQEAGDTDAEAIVLLHGIGADHKMWEPQIHVFADAGYQVLVPDLLGHGQSSKAKRLSLQDWEAQINDLLRHKGLHQCILVGVSMGGVIAQSFVVNHADRVSRLILSDTFGELKTVQERMLGWSHLVGFHVYKCLGSKLLARGMASTYQAPYAEQARTYFSEVSLNADFDQLILARKAINQADFIHKIDGKQIPTMVMVGDQFGKGFVEINRKIANGIQGAEFVVLEQSMDPSNLVASKAFNDHVLNFIRANSRGCPWGAMQF